MKTIKIATMAIGSATGGGGGIFAVAGSPVTLKFTLVFRNAPDNCEPLNSIVGCHN
jgi:hypothetical protein